MVYRRQRTSCCVRALDRSTPTAAGGTGAPRGLFVSPDGQWVGFFDGNTALKKVAITGGPAVTLTPRRWHCSPWRTWGEDGTIIYATRTHRDGLASRLLCRGHADRADQARPRAGEADHFWPEFLPGGQAVLFTIAASSGGLDDAQVAVLDFATGTYRRCWCAAAATRTTCRAGIWCTAPAGTLRAVAFDFGTPRGDWAPRCQSSRRW